MIEELDPRLEQFIEEYLDSFVSWDLILFFHHNPGVVDGAFGLAARLGRSVENVEEALEKLEAKGVVKKKGEDSVVYFYTPDESFEEKVKLFDQALENRFLRLKILSFLLKKGVR